MRGIMRSIIYMSSSLVVGAITGCFVGGADVSDDTSAPDVSDSSADGDTSEGGDASDSSDASDSGDTSDSGGTSDTSDSGDTSGADICGDGVTWGAEECDDGNLNNGDHCTNYCLLATCGDGYVFENIEECDDGDLDDTDACTSGCLIAACGDGHVHVDVEACDDGNTNSLDGCGPDCAPEWRYVFVTSETYTGVLGGALGADASCDSLAAAANLPGGYMAWVSDSGTSPSDRFIKSEVPYRRVDGVQIAASWMDVMDGDLDDAIAVTEQGELVEGEHVWTNTFGDGTSDVDFDCGDWTESSGSGLVGQSGQTLFSEWSVFAIVECSDTARLYCFQQ